MTRVHRLRYPLRERRRRQGIFAGDEPSGSHHRHRDVPNSGRCCGAARVCLWLQAEVRTMPPARPLIPQQPTFWTRLGMSQIDPKAKLGELFRRASHDLNRHSSQCKSAPGCERPPGGHKPRCIACPRGPMHSNQNMLTFPASAPASRVARSALLLVSADHSIPPRQQERS